MQNSLGELLYYASRLFWLISCSIDDGFRLKCNSLMYVNGTLKRHIFLTFIKPLVTFQNEVLVYITHIHKCKYNLERPDMRIYKVFPSTNVLTIRKVCL